MTPAQVRRASEDILARQVSLYADLERLQTACTHPNATKKHGASTGNYDPSENCYWTDFSCHDCGKRWTEEGSK